MRLKEALKMNADEVLPTLFSVYFFCYEFGHFPTPSQLLNVYSTERGTTMRLCVESIHLSHNTKTSVNSSIAKLRVALETGASIGG
jgi:hypothetical protein